MDWDTFDQLAPVFKNVDLVYLQGWGEPLLHPRFWDMVRRAREYGSKVGFTTSGELLDENNLSALLASGADIMAVSLAGGTAETHERFRPGANFLAIDNSLATLREMRKAVRSPLRLHLAFLLLRSNMGELQELVKLAKQWRAAEITVSNLTWVTSGAIESECLHAQPDLWPAAEAALEQALVQANAEGIDFHYSLACDEGLSPLCQENVLRACYVSADGDVSPCVFSGQELPRATEGMCFGNIEETPLAELWNSARAKLFRQIFLTRWQRNVRSAHGLPEVCAGCQRLREKENQPAR